MMNKELYEDTRNTLLSKNGKLLFRQTVFNVAATVGSLTSFMVASMSSGTVYNIASSVGVSLAVCGATGALIAIFTRSAIDNAARRVASTDNADNNENVFADLSIEENSISLEDGCYPEIYYRAEALRNYIREVAFMGYENLVSVLNTLMEQLKISMEASELEAYENIINKISARAYNKALEMYGLPVSEETVYDLDELVLKAKVLEAYIKDISYEGYNFDLDYLYQALRESEGGGITPKEFDEWIHYIAEKAYNCTLSESVIAR